MIKFQGRVVESTSIKNFSRCSRVCGSKLVGLRRLQHNCFQSSTTNDGHIYMLTNIVWPSCVSPGLGREYRIEKTQNLYSYWSSGPPCLTWTSLSSAWEPWTARRTLMVTFEAKLFSVCFWAFIGWYFVKTYLHRNSIFRAYFGFSVNVSKLSKTKAKTKSSAGLCGHYPFAHLDLSHGGHTGAWSTVTIGPDFFFWAAGLQIVNNQPKVNFANYKLNIEASQVVQDHVNVDVHM